MNVTEKPQWLELPEEKVRHTYWCCKCEVDEELDQTSIESGDRYWRVVHPTAEEAEAWICRKEVLPEGWAWNGEPPKSATLKEFMRRSRRDGDEGVEVISFRDGEWITIAEYRCDEPLPGDVE